MQLRYLEEDDERRQRQRAVCHQEFTERLAPHLRTASLRGVRLPLCCPQGSREKGHGPKEIPNCTGWRWLNTLQILRDAREYHDEQNVKGQTAVEFAKMGFPGAQGPEARERGDHDIFQVLHAHFAEECSVLVQPVRWQKVEFDENEKENNADLNEVENHFHVDFRGILVLVQEQGHGDEHIFKPKEESHDGSLRWFAVQHHFVIHPPEVRKAPHRNAHPDKQPEGPAQAVSPAGRSKHHHGRKPAGKDFQEVGNQGTRRGSSERRCLKKMQRDNDRGKDQGLSGHFLVVLSRSVLNFLLEFIL